MDLYIIILYFFIKINIDKIWFDNHNIYLQIKSIMRITPKKLNTNWGFQLISIYKAYNVLALKLLTDVTYAVIVGSSLVAK